jgi:hypothetical protein
MAVNVQQQDPKMNGLIPGEKIAGWEKLKTLVLDIISSITKRAYNMLYEFRQAPQVGFAKRRQVASPAW